MKLNGYRRMMTGGHVKRHGRNPGVRRIRVGRAVYEIALEARRAVAEHKARNQNVAEAGR